MVTERTIINLLIIGAVLVLIPFVISSTLTFNYVPVLFSFVIIALVVAFFVVKEKLCACPLLAVGIAGNLNFLPLPLNTSNIFSILLILYYLTGYVIIRQRRMRLGTTKFLWPILIITMIVIYHNHDLNVRVLGGEKEGGKAAILIYLAVLAYFCGINIPTPSVRFLGRIPLWFVVWNFVGAIPNLLTTYFPSLAPYLFTITDNVNVEAYASSQSGASTGLSGVIGRVAAFGPVGGALQLYLLCCYPIGTWIRPERWWVAGLSFICVLLAISSGYRNVIFGFVLTTMLGAWCYHSGRSFILPAALFLAGLILAIASSNNLIYVPQRDLPLIAQRTLSFLPGDWDEEAVQSAESSNEFRTNIQLVYMKEYVTRSPFLGNGFDIDTKEFNDLSDSLRNGRPGMDPKYVEAKTYIEGKLFHTGWVSLYDAVGIIGSITFVALGWNQIRVGYHFVFGRKADRRSTLFPLYVWLLCNSVATLVLYFTVFGDFKETFMDMCVYAIILSHLLDIERNTDVPVVLPDRLGRMKFTGFKGSLEGSPSGI